MRVFIDDRISEQRRHPAIGGSHTDLAKSRRGHPLFVDSAVSRGERWASGRVVTLSTLTEFEVLRYNCIDILGYTYSCAAGAHEVDR